MPFFLVCLLLQCEGLEDVRRWRNGKDLDAVDPDAPLVGDSLHLLLHIGVDALAFRERLVEGHRADHRPQGGACECIDRHVEVRDAEERLPGVDDLREDGRVDVDHHVVLGDHILTVARARDLPHVHALQGLDERRDDHQAGLVSLAVLAEVFHDADLALLDDVDHLPQRKDQHQHNKGDDDEADETWDADGCDHVCSSSPLLEARAFARLRLPLQRQRIADGPHDERGALHGCHEDSGAGRYRRIVATDRAPALAGEPDVTDPVQTSNEVEREHFLPDEASVHTSRSLDLVVMGEGSAHAAADKEDPQSGHHDRGGDLYGDGVRKNRGHGGAGEAAQGGEQGVERQVVQLHGDQHDANGDPREGHPTPSFCAGILDPTGGCRGNGAVPSTDERRNTPSASSLEDTGGRSLLVAARPVASRRTPPARFSLRRRSPCTCRRGRRARPRTPPTSTGSPPTVTTGLPSTRLARPPP